MANGEVRFRDPLELTGDIDRDRVQALLRNAFIELDLIAGLLALAVSEVDRIQLYVHFVLTTPCSWRTSRPREITHRVTAAVYDLVESQRRLLSIVRWLLVFATSRAHHLCHAVLLAAAAAALVVYAAWRLGPGAP